MGSPAIEFRDVAYAWPGSRRVLEGVSFEVGAGETLALVGRSGAGKSTILRLINRLLEPESGTVIVDGRDAQRWNPYDLRRHAGYVLQEIGLFPHMTVAANVAVVPRLLGWDTSSVSTRVDALLTMVGLDPTEYAGRWPDELSGGQRQRVGIARALAADPPVLLMDEPFGALDPVTRADLRREFRSIQGALRKAVVLVTHDMTEAFALGDRVGVIEAGALIAWDTPARLASSDDVRVRSLLQPGDRT